MFRASNTPIFRSIRLCVTACGIMYPGYWPATSWIHCTTNCNAQFNAPEDGRVRLPKHVELIGIINTPLFLHLVGVYIIYINDGRSNKYQIMNKNLSLLLICHCNIFGRVSTLVNVQNWRDFVCDS